MVREHLIHEILIEDYNNKTIDIEEEHFKCSSTTLNEILNIDKLFISQLLNIKSLNIYEDNKNIPFKLIDKCFSGIETIEYIIFECDIITEGSHWFSECINLKKIKGLKLEIIKKKAFYNCKIMEEYDNGIYVKKIESNAFNGCELIKYLYFPNCKEFGDSCFMNTSINNIIKDHYIHIDKKILLNKKYIYICEDEKSIYPIETNIRYIKII